MHFRNTYAGNKEWNVVCIDQMDKHTFPVFFNSRESDLTVPCTTIKVPSNCISAAARSREEVMKELSCRIEKQQKDIVELKSDDKREYWVFHSEPSVFPEIDHEGYYGFMYASVCALEQTERYSWKLSRIQKTKKNDTE